MHRNFPTNRHQFSTEHQRGNPTPFLLIISGGFFLRACELTLTVYSASTCLPSIRSLNSFAEDHWFPTMIFLFKFSYLTHFPSPVNCFDFAAFQQCFTDGYSVSLLISMPVLQVGNFIYLLSDWPRKSSRRVKRCSKLRSTCYKV